MTFEEYVYVSCVVSHCMGGNKPVLIAPLGLTMPILEGRTELYLFLM